MSLNKIIIAIVGILIAHSFITNYFKPQITNNENSIVSATQIAGMTIMKEAPKMRLSPEQESALGSILIQAQTKNKPIILYFYADWCSSCKRFAPVINDISREYANKCLYIPINADNEETKSLLSIFGVPGYPTVYIIDSITKKYIEGGQDKSDLKNYLNIFLESK